MKQIAGLCRGCDHRWRGPPLSRAEQTVCADCWKAVPSQRRINAEIAMSKLSGSLQQSLSAQGDYGSICILDRWIVR